MRGEVKYSFTCLLIIYVSFMNCLFRSVTHLKILLIIFMVDLQVIFLLKILIQCVHIKLQFFSNLAFSFNFLSFLKIVQSL